jgi:acid phosphatase type 7
VVAAAGDVACAPPGTPTATKCHQLGTSNLLGARHAAVLPLGDLQYETGALADFQAVYDPSWGRVRSRSHPVPGDGEYGTPGAAGYFGYFGDRATPQDRGCQSACRGYYAHDVGAWRVIALNSNCLAPGSAAAERRRRRAGG